MTRAIAPLASPRNRLIRALSRCSPFFDPVFSMTLGTQTASVTANKLNASFTRLGRGVTMNFLLCDTCNIEILSTRDILRCIIIVNEFISLRSPVTPMALQCNFARFTYFLRLSIISYCFLCCYVPGPTINHNLSVGHTYSVKTLNYHQTSFKSKRSLGLLFIKVKHRKSRVFPCSIATCGGRT